jgi:2-methylisocitrate lyase-like PEP mutase family enzyme
VRPPGRIGERLPDLLMAMLTDGGLKAMEMTKTDLAALGFKLLIDPVTPLLVLHKTWRQCYQAIACGDPAAPFGSDSVKGEHKALHETIGLDALLAIERATVEL